MRCGGLGEEGYLDGRDLASVFPLAPPERSHLAVRGQHWLLGRTAGVRHPLLERVTTRCLRPCPDFSRSRRRTRCAGQCGVTVRARRSTSGGSRRTATSSRGGGPHQRMAELLPDDAAARRPPRFVLSTSGHNRGHRQHRPATSGPPTGIAATDTARRRAVGGLATTSQEPGWTDWDEWLADARAGCAPRPRGSAIGGQARGRGTRSTSSSRDAMPAGTGGVARVHSAHGPPGIHSDAAAGREPARAGVRRAPGRRAAAQATAERHSHDVDALQLERVEEALRAARDLHSERRNGVEEAPERGTERTRRPHP